MDEMKLVHDIITQIWKDAKGIAFRSEKLTDDEWEKHIAESNIKSAAYEKFGRRYSRLYNSILYAIHDYILDRERERK